MSQTEGLEESFGFYDEINNIFYQFLDKDSFEEFLTFLNSI